MQVMVLMIEDKIIARFQVSEDWCRALLPNPENRKGDPSEVFLSLIKNRHIRKRNAYFDS